MRVDFIKEVNGNEIWYYTSINGDYVAGSISHDSEKAMGLYERFISGSIEPQLTIIRTTNIEDGTTITKP